MKVVFALRLSLNKERLPVVPPGPTPHPKDQPSSLTWRSTSTSKSRRIPRPSSHGLLIWRRAEDRPLAPTALPACWNDARNSLG